jgi:myo-inositol-1(or 4)-monophosphatase
LTHHINRLTEFAISLADAAASVTLPMFRQQLTVEAKQAADWDPVTEADRGAERVIRQMIQEGYPAHGIEGEEYGSHQPESPYQWIIDPIDGTRAFVVGMPTWGTLIGLYHNGKPLLGVMSQPYVGETFVGNPEGAWLIRNGNRTPLKVRPAETLASARIGTTNPHRYEGHDAAALIMLRETCQMMRYGGDAYFFCLVAAGHLEVAMDPGLQSYDIAALIPIITGAGGVVDTWTGSDPSRGGNVIAAASPSLMAEVKAIMSSI